MTSPTRPPKHNGAGKASHANESGSSDDSDAVLGVAGKTNGPSLGRFGRMFPTYVRAGSVRVCACERWEICVRIVRGKEWNVWPWHLNGSRESLKRRFRRSQLT